MLRYGTKTINQKIQIDEEEYDITVKVIHNTETPQITMSVKSDQDLFNIELTQVDMSTAHMVLNEVMNVFRAATGLPMPPMMAPGPAQVAMSPGYPGSFYSK